MKFSSPCFLADKKKWWKKALPVTCRLARYGNFRIGDTLPREKMFFKGIPSFSPEFFRYINNADPMKTKQLERGLPTDGRRSGSIVYIGMPQLKTQDGGRYSTRSFSIVWNMNGAKVTYENFPAYKACWVEAVREIRGIQRIQKNQTKYLARDNQMVFLADSSFTIQMSRRNSLKLL